MNPLHHIRITVADREGSVHFWSPVLAFLGFSLLDENADRVCFAAGPAGTGMRFLICQAPPEFRDDHFELGRPGLHHVAFAATGRGQVDELYDLLVALGAPTQGPPAFYDYSPGYYAVYFRDPDNLKFELAHVPPDGDQTQGPSQP